MKIFSQEEWARNQYKGKWEASRWNLDRVEAGEVPAGYIGRRNCLVYDNGTALITEGINFLVEGEYNYLPFLLKENAMEGACYQFPGGYIEVTRVYTLSLEEAAENDLYFLDRVDYIQHAEWGATKGGCGLVDGATRKM